MEVTDWGRSRFGCVLLMTISLSSKSHKNLSSLNVSRTLPKNDDTLVEFIRTLRLLTGDGVLDHVLDVFL